MLKLFYLTDLFNLKFKRFWCYQDGIFGKVIVFVMAMVSFIVYDLKAAGF